VTFLSEFSTWENSDRNNGSSRTSVLTFPAFFLARIRPRINLLRCNSFLKFLTNPRKGSIGASKYSLALGDASRKRTVLLKHLKDLAKYRSENNFVQNNYVKRSNLLLGYLSIVRIFYPVNPASL